MSIKANVYDPHLHRNSPHATPTIPTFIHLLKALIGTGIFAMPKAFQQSGYLVGSISTFLIGILLTYCLHILTRSQYLLCKRQQMPVISYSLAMKLALKEGPPKLRWLAPIAITIVNIFVLINQIGISCIYTMFVAQNLKAALRDWIELSVPQYMCAMLPFAIALMCIRNLKVLAPLSLAANFITIIGIGLILSNVFEDTPSLSERRAVGDILDYPLFFGTTLFALVAVAVVNSLENHMKYPKSFVAPFGVLNCGMTFAVLLYILFAFLGYLKYGDDIKDSITLNLSSEDVTTKVIQLLFAVAIFLTSALQCYTAVEIIWGGYVSKLIKNPMGVFLVRIPLVLLTFALAYSIQNLGLVISLSGAFCLSMLGVAFPALMEICTLYPMNVPNYNFVVKRNILIMIVGFIALVTGTVKSMVDVAKN